jgi:hypothetical protein
MNMEERLKMLIEVWRGHAERATTKYRNVPPETYDRAAYEAMAYTWLECANDLQVELNQIQVKGIKNDKARQSSDCDLPNGGNAGNNPS